MSLKPPKKSDKNKEWMKPRQDKRILVQPEYHLIVTEGTKSVVKLCPLQAKLHTTLFGQMNVLNYGFSYIFNIWIPL